MTNDEIDLLTALAYDVRARLTPELMIDGRGWFRALDGALVSSSEVLSRMTEAGDLAQRLHALLAETPRRKGRGKA